MEMHWSCKNWVVTEQIWLKSKEGLAINFDFCVQNNATAIPGLGLKSLIPHRLFTKPSSIKSH